MARIRNTEGVALICLGDAEKIVEGIFPSAEARGSITEIHRLAVYGQALLLVREKATESGLRTSDVAAALSRIIGGAS